MYRFLLLAVALLAGCTENFLLNTSGTGPGSGLDSAITALTISPNQFEMTNGQRASAVVRAFAGALEVTDFRFEAVMSPNQNVATIESVNGNVVLFKAENKGETHLVITVRPGVEARAPVKVVAAD